MRYTHNTRRAMHIQADVSLVGRLRFAGVHAHAYTHHRPFRPVSVEERALRMYRRSHRVGGTLKDHEEGITLRINLDAICLLKSRAQQATALPQHTSLAIAK